MRAFLRRNLLSVMVILILGGAIAFGIQNVRASESHQVTTEESQRTVSVNGVGQVQAEPDRAVIRVGVQTEAESASRALSQNNNQMQDVIDALREEGVAAQDIQTQTFRLNPIRETPRPEGDIPEITGYMATNIVEVRVEDIDNLGNLLDTAIQAGGNTIEGIQFEVSDPSDLVDQAREAAMNDAQNKAEQLAELAGAQLGDVFTISESSRTPVPVGRGGAAQLEAAAPVEPGTQTVTVDVQVTWLLR